MSAVVEAYGKVFAEVAAEVIAPEMLRVDDAWIPPWNQMGLVVALVVAPKLVVGVNGKANRSFVSANVPALSGNVYVLFDVIAAVFSVAAVEPLARSKVLAPLYNSIKLLLASIPAVLFANKLKPPLAPESILNVPVVLSHVKLASPPKAPPSLN